MYSGLTHVHPEMVPVRARCGCGAPGADRRGSRFHIHSTAKEFQVHVHLQQGKMLNPRSESTK